MIDHLTLLVSDAAKTRDLLLEALAPLQYALVMELTPEQVPSLNTKLAVGLGAGGKPDLWLRQVDGEVAGTHVALTAKDRAAVDAFHAAALAAGAKDHGAPGVRAHYHEHYYGAFVLDGDGNNIEVVCHAPG
ncbi:MAG: VOC family protein [Myxococcota bacterium]